MIKVNIITDEITWNPVIPDRMQCERSIVSVMFLSDASPESDHTQTSEKSKLKEILWNCRIIFKGLKVMKVKDWRTVPDEHSRNITTKCSMWFWTGFFCSEAHYCDNCQILNRVWGSGCSKESVSSLWQLYCSYVEERLSRICTLKYLGWWASGHKLNLRWFGKKEEKFFLLYLQFFCELEIASKILK